MLIVNLLNLKPNFTNSSVFFYFSNRNHLSKEKAVLINNDLTDDATECYGAARIMKYCGFFSGKHRYKRLTYTRMHKSVHMCTVY